MLWFMRQEREGAVVDRGLVRSCVELYEAMGLKTLDVYKADFEEPLLVATRSVSASA